MRVSHFQIHDRLVSKRTFGIVAVYQRQSITRNTSVIRKPTAIRTARKLWMRECENTISKEISTKCLLRNGMPSKCGRLIRLGRLFGHWSHCCWHQRAPFKSICVKLCCWLCCEPSTIWTLLTLPWRQPISRREHCIRFEHCPGRSSMASTTVRRATVFVRLFRTMVIFHLPLIIIDISVRSFIVGIAPLP